MNNKTGSRAEALRRFTFIAALILAAFATGPAFGQVNGIVANDSKGAVILGSPAGGGNCTAANTGAIRYNSTTPRIEFCNGTSWLASGGLTLISTQTASASASLQFSGANWSSSYNTLFLNCSSIVLTANAHNVALEVGEGAGPTWETASHYSQSPDGTTVASDIFDGMFNQTATTKAISFKFYISNVSSSTVYKMFNGFFGLDGSPGNGFAGDVVSAYWNNDTNPLTGVELVANGTTIASGTCSLYGMN
jgi:hypothetical protein